MPSSVTVNRPITRNRVCTKPGTVHLCVPDDGYIMPVMGGGDAYWSASWATTGVTASRSAASKTM